MGASRFCLSAWWMMLAGQCEPAALVMAYTGSTNRAEKTSMAMSSTAGVGWGRVGSGCRRTALGDAKMALVGGCLGEWRLEHAVHRGGWAGCTAPCCDAAGCHVRKFSSCK